MVAVALAYFGFFAAFPERFFPLGIQHFGVWFLDTHAILAASDAAARGRDVYVGNALDPLGRQHVYSHWWLGLSRLGLTRADASWIGAVLVAAFLAVALWQLKPREPAETAWYLLILCASPTLLAVERANNDLVVFLLLAPIAACLRAGARWLRFVPILLIASAAALKFYPAAAASLLIVGADGREVRVRFWVATLAFAAVLLTLRHDLARLGMVMPQPEGLMTFGAINLVGRLGGSGLVAGVAGLAFAAVIGIAVVRSTAFRQWRPDMGSTEWLNFVLGAVLLSGCFFTAANFSYRWIFALWLAPFLWRMLRDSSTPTAVRRIATATAALLLFVLWGDPFVAAILNAMLGRHAPEIIMTWAERWFAWEQPLVWAFFGCLLAFLAHFTRCVLSRR